jgi:hypothetical protein
MRVRLIDRLRKDRRSTWLVLAAFVVQALLPLAMAGALPSAAARSTAAPVTLCTAQGVRVVGAPAQAPHDAAGGDHCPLCRLAAGDALPPPVAVPRAWVGDAPAAVAALVHAVDGPARWSPLAPRAPPRA